MIVALDLFRMLSAVAGEVAGLFGEPSLGVGVTAFEATGMSFFPLGLVVFVASFLTLRFGAGYLL